MKTTIARLVSVIALASSVSAQSPFEANWTLNQEKSNFTATTMAIEDAASGAIKFVKPAFTYTVKIDGTKTGTPTGAMVAIQKQADGSYHETDGATEKN